MIGYFGKSEWLTYGGAISALVGIISLLVTTDIKIAVISLAVSGICDLFDGKVANSFSRSEHRKNFGIQLDSMCDIVSFIILPIIIMTKMYPSIISYIISIIYLVCGINRLAYFNISSSETFEGLPVTTQMLFVPISILTSRFTGEIIIPIVYLVVSILFVIRINISKPSIGIRAIIGLLSIASVIGVIIC